MRRICGRCKSGAAPSGMGLDEFSMASNEIAAVRYQVRGLAAKQTAELARRALAAGTEKEVRGLLER